VVHRQRPKILLEIDTNFGNDDDEYHHEEAVTAGVNYTGRGTAAAVFPSTTKALLSVIDTEI
jgi:hypothetical protein